MADSNMPPAVQARLEGAARARRNRMVTLGVVAAVLVVIVGGGIWWQSSRTQVAPEADAGPTVSAERLDTGIELGTGSTTVDLYLDFLCPHCADLEDRVGDELVSMVEDGTITLVLRPLTFLHPQESARSAAALSCAADSGAVLGFQRALFANQDGGFSDERILEIAASVGIDDDAFVACVQDGEQLEWAAAVNKAATLAKVKGTPTIYVDGKKFDLEKTETPEQFRSAVLGSG